MTNKLHNFFWILLLFFLNTTYADKIAIIGGGAAGLTTAWLLEQHHDITLYEASDKLGGHADSIEIMINGQPVVIEAGAEFFNEKFYPHFLKLLRFYNIPLNKFTLVTTFYKTDGSDEIILPPYHDGTVEWKSLTPTNISRSLQLKKIIDKGRQVIESKEKETLLIDFLDSITLKLSFKNDFFFPLIAAAWGTNIPSVPYFSAYNAVKYLVEGYDNENYQWHEITGGMKSYIAAVKKALLHATVKLNAAVQQIGMNNGHYTLLAADGSYEEYEQLILATNAKIASSLLNTLPETKDLAKLLSQIKYYDTQVAIHSDVRFMPLKKEDWRVVNIRYDGKNSAITMYKEWESPIPIFKTWITYDVRYPNDKGGKLPTNLYALRTYQHPFVDSTYFKVQKAIAAMQGDKNIWFAGNWTFDNDSHESAINSAIKIAQVLAPSSDRLKILTN